MNVLKRLFRNPTTSAKVAKERLQLVIAHDRADISTEVLEALKDEIVNVISRHIEIDRANVEVQIAHTDHAYGLIANIPFTSSRRKKIIGT